LFIIHNLQTFSLKEQVQDYINDTLLKSATFKLKKKKFAKAGEALKEDISNYTYFIEEFQENKDKKVINHLILAMHGTEAGDYYNQFVYDFLSEQFNSQPIHEKFPVVEAVKQQCIDSSKNIMETPIDSINDFEGNEDEIKLKTTTEDGKEKKLSFKRCFIDELGFSSFYGTNFEPKFSCYKTCVDKRQYLCINVEIPGESKCKCKAEIGEGIWNISVSGKKLIDTKDIIDPKTSKNNREEGTFLLNIKLDSTEFQLRDKRPDKSLTKTENGLYRYYFPLMGDDPDTSDSNEED